jgi:branched-chain amino acid transport system permease protein
MDQVLQQLIFGLSVGATYALIALGYTMVYGVLRLINFAHGDVYMAGAVVAFYLARLFAGANLSPWISLPLLFVASMLACSVLGFAIEFIAYRPLRDRPRLTLLITAIGVSLLLENLSILIYGPTPRSLPRLIESRALLTLAVGDGHVVISNIDALTFGVSVVMMALLTWIVLGTKTGLALRAVSYRFDTAMLMGINTNRVISFTFVLGSALAAVAGVFDAVRYDVRWNMGILPGLKAFIAAVLGGIGSIPGALIGALLIGVTEAMLRGIVLPRLFGPGYEGYADAVAFLILIVILIVKPSGLMGRRTTEKV